MSMLPTPLTPLSSDPPVQTSKNLLFIGAIFVIVVLTGLTFYAQSHSTAEKSSVAPNAFQPSNPVVIPVAPAGPPKIYSERDLEQLRRLDAISHDIDQRQQKNK